MSKALTIKQIDDILFIHLYRQKLPEEIHPYFDWWVHMVSTKQFKVPEQREWMHSTVEVEVWVPPDLRNAQVVDEEEALY